MSGEKVPAYAVFSGGGSQGIALAGAYQAALDAGFEFKGFGGASAGSIIAVMAAAGMTGEEILEVSERGKRGHPSNFFTDSARASEAPLSISHIQGEIESIFENPISQEKKRRLPYSEEDDPQLSDTEAKGALPEFKTDFKTRFSSSLFRISVLAVLVALLALGAIIATLSQIAMHLLWNWNFSFAGPIAVVGSFVLTFCLMIAIWAMLPRPIREIPFFGFAWSSTKRGRFWRKIEHTMRSQFGLLRGDGLLEALQSLGNKKLQERIKKVVETYDLKIAEAKKQHATACADLEKYRSQKRQEGRRVTARREELFNRAIAISKRIEEQFIERRGAYIKYTENIDFKSITFIQFDVIFETPIKIIASDLWLGRSVVLSRRTHGDMSVCDAVRASAAFPLVFQPLLRRRKTPEGLHILPEVLSDGGLSSNSPGFLFKTESDLTNEPTISFQLKYASSGANFPRNLFDLIIATIKTLVGAGDEIITDLTSNLHVVPVDGVDEFGVLDSNLSTRAMRRLYSVGRIKKKSLIELHTQRLSMRQLSRIEELSWNPIIEYFNHELKKHFGNETKGPICAVYTPSDWQYQKWSLIKHRESNGFSKDITLSNNRLGFLLESNFEDSLQKFPMHNVEYLAATAAPVFVTMLQALMVGEPSTRSVGDLHFLALPIRCDPDNPLFHEKREVIGMVVVMWQDDSEGPPWVEIAIQDGPFLSDKLFQIRNRWQYTFVRLLSA